MGEIERPRLWKLQFTTDPGAHVMLLGIRPLSLADFTAQATSAFGQCSRKELLLFVHGYNVKFEDALLRTAQVAYDLHFVGIPALFSWPSEGAASMYTVDVNNVTWSRPHFAQYLQVLREQLGTQTVHIVAHSMGTRLVAETIAAMTPPQAAFGARFRQIVLAAPDIDADTFKNFAKAFPEKADRFTLYASSADKALAASKIVNGYPPAGDAGQNLVIVNAVDTVDASTVYTDFIGHAYYGDNRSVLSDIFQVIRNGTPPQDRQLKEMTRGDQRYWLFSP
jgi:esterase/lipase superfamily enzyme